MRECLECGISFPVTGKNHKWCKECAHKRRKKQVADWQSTYKTKLPGVGKGGAPHSEILNPMYKHGICVMRRWAREKLEQLNYCCERCGTKIDRSARGSWAGHHKDHNRKNNVRENLEVLCRRCHAIEHECWRAFQGVTTIPRGSTPETAEAHSTKR